MPQGKRNLNVERADAPQEKLQATIRAPPTPSEGKALTDFRPLFRPNRPWNHSENGSFRKGYRILTKIVIKHAVFKCIHAAHRATLTATITHKGPSLILESDLRMAVSTDSVKV